MPVTSPETMSAESAVLRLLEERSPVATICPSEAARVLGGADWRQAMPLVHAAARALASAGRVRLTQRGRAVDEPHGAYRIGRQTSAAG